MSRLYTKSDFRIISKGTSSWKLFKVQERVPVLSKLNKIIQYLTLSSVDNEDQEKWIDVTEFNLYSREAAETLVETVIINRNQSEWKVEGKCKSYSEVPFGAQILSVNGRIVISNCMLCGKPILEGQKFASYYEGEACCKCENTKNNIIMCKCRRMLC